MRELVVITGMSGSGKSVALSALEDAGYYCIDNLPPELLLPSLTLERNQQISRMAIVIDVRSAASLPLVPPILQNVRDQGVNVRVLFLDASTDALVRRFSETRRKHPLAADADAHGDDALVQIILRERGLMGSLRDMSLVIDTSLTRSAELQSQLKQILRLGPGHLVLIFQSFSYKRGIPRDADYVFDVRMLPNPHYDPALRPLTGLDAPVAEFLAREPLVHVMQHDVTAFLHKWLPQHAQNHRSYVSVAIGCTGGQHRSVYLVEQLAEQFAQEEWQTLRRHREIERRANAAVGQS
ncbi:RNase adapter RapZ [Vandammella animalimorsus]|uniref:RNase adapter RapZ n=1 Tax=Vandammella animalimorsus TaxID=2029117 RepID=A0A2A2ASD5_9BURK|nr:RNase adapter RapZ [Vandammella animalimorsus]PAT40604.1 RNase adapter RapZ [Vandammella animalimorsus]